MSETILVHHFSFDNSKKLFEIIKKIIFKIVSTVKIFIQFF